MEQVRGYRPEYSLVLISQPNYGKVPDLQGRLVAATDTCIAVGCLCEADGPTTFTLAQINEVVMREEAIFEGYIDTPHQAIAIQDVEGSNILESSTKSARTLVRIWSNDPTEPDNIVVGFE